MADTTTGYVTIIVFPKRNYEVTHIKNSSPSVPYSNLLPLIVEWAHSHAQVVGKPTVYRIEYGMDGDSLRYHWYEGSPRDGLTDDEWLEDPDFVPTEDTEQTAAITASEELLMAKVRTYTLQTASFTTAEFVLLAKAKMFDSWQAGVTYEAGYRIEHEGVVYEVIQKVTAIDNQPPNAQGMLAIYRPLSVDVETGKEPNGSVDDPYTFMYGMDVQTGMYYKYNEHIYQAQLDMPNCVWTPDTPGLWQWKLIE